MAHHKSPSPPQPFPSSGSEQAIGTDERRRIARELHDSTSQALVTLQLQLGRLGRMKQPGSSFVIRECEQAVAAIRDQLRALDRDEV